MFFMAAQIKGEFMMFADHRRKTYSDVKLSIKISIKWAQNLYRVIK